MESVTASVHSSHILGALTPLASAVAVMASWSPGGSLPGSRPACRKWPMRLADKVILVTGSTTGIGEAMARRFVAEGARVVIHGTRRDAGEQVAASLGKSAACCRGDLADPAAATEL